MNTFQKHPKSWIILGIALTIGFFAVMGIHFSEAAQKPFWWKFWEVIAVVCIVAWVGLWLYFNAKDKQSR